MRSAATLSSPSRAAGESLQAAVPGRRMPLVDLLKAVAAQLIALHHLAFYGPMSDWTHRLAPDWVEWFSQQGRLAVQVFLVVSGFLAAYSLAPKGTPRVDQPLARLWQRYVRLGVPFMVALGLAALCAAVARAWMVHDSVPAAPTAVQWVAHALMLHTLLDVESLSAGVWYVAIDLQLYALLLGLVWGSRSRATLMAWVLVGVAASQFHFNRNAHWDAWAIYFFGAYGLGALAHWFSAGSASGANPRQARWGLLLLVGLTAVALLLDYRDRLALALATAVLLGWAQHRGWLFTWPNWAWTARLSRWSYAVFLLNFPVGLLVNAWFTRFAAADAQVQTFGVLVAWGLINLAAAVFHAQVEVRLVRLVSGWRLPSWPLAAGTGR